MRRAAFIAAMAALAWAGIAGGAPTPTDRPTPQVAIFYYAWYGTPTSDGAWEHWGQGGNAPPQAIGSNFYPARGPYSSGRPAIVRAQMREIAGTGVDTVIVSWWGPGSVEDARLPSVVAAAQSVGPACRAPRRAVGRPNAAGGRRRAPRLHLARHPRRVRLRLGRLARRGLALGAGRA